MLTQWNHEIFQRIDTEGKAWLLGWLYGKGGVTTYSGNTYLNIYIPFRDRLLLPTFRELLGHTGVVTRDLRPEKNVDYFRIRLPASGLEPTLDDLGLLHTESIQADRPIYNSVPPELRRHMFRGYGESRGSWGRGRQRYFYISGSLDCIKAFRQWTDDIGLRGRRRIHTYKAHKMFIIARGDILKLYSAFYTCNPKFTVAWQREGAEQAIIQCK